MLKTPAFSLSPQIESDSFKVLDLELCTVRLSKDCRWPWVILVPRVGNVEELFDMSPKNQTVAMRETARVGTALKTLTDCTKINIAMIGNIVRQLHIHVVARDEGDMNWPGPIWGVGSAENYTNQSEDQLISELRNELSD